MKRSSSAYFFVSGEAATSQALALAMTRTNVNMKMRIACFMLLFRLSEDVAKIHYLAESTKPIVVLFEKKRAEPCFTTWPRKQT